MERSRTRLDEILYIRSAGRGWAPVHAMVELAGSLLEAPVRVVDDRTLSRARRSASLLPRAGRRRGIRLTIACNPAQLALVGGLDHWLPGYREEVAWVVDSFWSERIPRFARGGRFDRIFVFDGDVVDEWAAVTGSPVTFLPWGTDTLAVPTLDRARPVDLQRVGRQPASYDDDAALIAAAGTLGLTAAGRPPFAENPLDDQREMLELLGQTKYVLAFGVKDAPGPYTHPTRDYLTARWVDALGQGALVAGSVPRCHASDELLWPGSVLEIDPLDMASGIATVAEAVAAWTPEIAAETRAEARQRLDWRHRFVAICDHLGHEAPGRLRAELAGLRGSQ